VSERLEFSRASLMGVPYAQRGRETTQVLLALFFFALPIVCLPLALRESATGLWVQAGLPQHVVEKVSISADGAPLIHVLVQNRGVYQSADNGATWRQANSGLPSTSWGQVQVQAFAVDTQQPATLYAGMAEIGLADSALRTGLYMSGDGGTTWLAVGRDMVGKAVQAIGVMAPPAHHVDNPGSSVCVATGAELYCSRDHGQSWSRLDWRGVETSILSIAIRPGQPDVVYLGTKGRGIYRTENGGAAWEAILANLEDVDINHITIAPGQPSLMYLATSSGVYRSLDAGSTWTQLEGPTQERRINAVVAHPSDGSALCAALEHGAASCSSDGGQTWTALRRGLGDVTVLSLAIDPRNESILWAGTTDGIWRHVFESPLSERALPSTETATPSQAIDATPAPTGTATATPPATPTGVPTRMVTATTMPTPTMTATATPQPSPTFSPTATTTATPAATDTPRQEPGPSGDSATAVPSPTEAAIRR